MEFMAELSVVIGLACVIACLIIAVIKFVQASKEQQIKKVKEY